MGSFVLLSYASLTASKTLLEQSLACLSFTLGPEGLFCWQQHKQLKTMEMSEAWPDTYNERCIHQFQPEPIYKIH